MATIVASSILDKAEIILQDTSNIRWDETELLGWLNDGQREVVLHKPSANPVNETLQLSSAGTRQSIPDNGLALIDVVCNHTINGTSVKRSIRVIDRRILDAQRPDWHNEAATASDPIVHFCFDDRDPRTFYLYPGAPLNTKVQIVYAASPVDISSASSVITIDDVYANALLDYVLYRAYSKDADYAANEQRVMAAYQTFVNSLGIFEQSSMQSNPNYRTLSNVSPTYVGPSMPRTSGERR